MDSTRLPAGTDRDVPRLRRRLPQDNRQGIRQNKGPGWGGRQRKGKTINNLMLVGSWELFPSPKQIISQFLTDTPSYGRILRLEIPSNCRHVQCGTFTLIYHSGRSMRFFLQKAWDERLYVMYNNLMLLYCTQYVMSQNLQSVAKYFWWLKLEFHLW